MTTTEVTRDYEGSTIPVAGTYVIDPVHTSVAFHVRHMMVSKVRGRFATMPRDGATQGQGRLVVHETRAQADAP